MVLKKVVGIVGSPRKGKLTDQVVTKCLEGVISEGVKCEKIYLIDYQIPYYTEQAKCPEELNVLCEKADALVIGAPGYWGGINGLTKDFMDIVRISNSNGKYGLGISVAGGTGRGLCSALQNIYRFFYHRSIRAIDPTPVSRFNFNLAVEALYKSGKKLAKLPLKKTPFKGNEDRITYYEKLDYLNYNYTDEMLFLAGQLVQISKGKPNFQNAEEEYESAKSLIRQGKRIKALQYITKAYNTLYFDPPEE
jgi:multimeric flavodoxin WrbA